MAIKSQTEKVHPASDPHQQTTIPPKPPSTETDPHQLPQYRREVLCSLLSHSEAENVIMMDDVHHACNPRQRQHLHGFPGYMRCLLPAAEMAAIVPVHVLALTPPLLQEVRHALGIVEKLEGKASNLHVWYKSPKTGELLDLASMAADPGTADIYNRLVKACASTPPPYDPLDYPRMAEALKKSGQAEGRTLILPFQTTDEHTDLYDSLLKSGSAVLPASADRFRDKALAARLLSTLNPEIAQHFPSPQSVELKPDLRACDEIPSRTSTLQGSAERIIDICIEKERRHQGSYIKLDGAGVSGIDNLSPDLHPQIYEGPREDRVRALLHEITRHNWRPDDYPVAVIEERLLKEKDQLGTRELSMAGLLIDGTFHPFSIMRQIVRNDLFSGMIASSDPALIGIEPETRKAAMELVSSCALAMADVGYRTGYVAKDFLPGCGGVLKIHDHNDRRGGRSFLETLVGLNPGKVYVDQDFEFPASPDKAPIDQSLEIAAALEHCGFLIYGTSTVHYPVEHPRGLRLKFKIVTEVPPELLSEAGDLGQRMAGHVTERLNQALKQATAGDE